jgi:hypothetical protein
MMKGTRHGPIDRVWETIKHNLRVVHNVHAEVADIAFETGYRKGYSNGAEDAFSYATDALAGLGDVLADEQRDGYFRGKAESEKAE